MTSGTDELRRMLDERGVEWWEATPCKTKWNSPIIGGPVAAREWNGEMVLDTGYIAVTPEQAIAATLGSCNCSSNCTKGERTETCHDKNGFDVTFGFECTVCGAMTDGYMLSTADMGHYKQFNFCPNCGRRIEQ